MPVQAADGVWGFGSLQILGRRRCSLATDEHRVLIWYLWKLGENDIRFEGMDTCFGERRRHGGEIL